MSAISGMVLADIAHRGAVLWPDRPAFHWAGRSRTYRELADRAARTRRMLQADGLRRGDRLAVLSVNTPEVIETYLAASSIGAVVVPLNVRLAPHDLAFQVGDSGATHALVHPALLDLAREAGLLALRHRVIGDGLDAALAAHDGPPGPMPHAGGPSDAVMQIYTSGTTGRPKGCLLSNQGWIAADANLAHAYQLTSGDRLAAVYPFFHVAGFGLALTFLTVGGTVVLAPGADPGDVWQAVADHECTVVGFPRLRDALDHPAAARGGASVRLVYGGAAMEDTATLERIARAAPRARWIGGFGATEAGNFVMTASLDEERARPGTIGRPMLGFDVTVLSEDGRHLGPGEVGELGLRGPSTMIGYAGLPAETEAATRGGWLHTGDLVRIDEDGYVYFVDRLKDMIRSGNENVYSIEVETALLAHPDVADVAVIGVPDDRWGEAVKAIVVAAGAVAPAPEALDDFCLDRLAAFKRPRWYEFVQEIPRSQTAKLVKKDLRAAHDPRACVRLGERTA